MAVASVYGACRCNGPPRTLDDVTQSAYVEQSRVINTYMTLNTELELLAKPVTPSGFIPRLVSQLDISDQIRRGSANSQRMLG